MLPEQQKKFEFRIKNIREAQPRSMIVYANTVSIAVELFLQDYLKNNRLCVEIVEHSSVTRRI
jgi:hypothetical protein